MNRRDHFALEIAKVLWAMPLEQFKDFHKDAVIRGVDNGFNVTAMAIDLADNLIESLDKVKK